MEQLRQKVRELFDKQDVKLVVGYCSGEKAVARPVFIDSPDKADKLIFDDTCVQNLAVYLNKPEVRRFGKIAIVANIFALRSMLVFSSENQLKGDSVIALTVAPDGKLLELGNPQEIEAYVATQKVGIPEFAKTKIEEISALPREERWNFWEKELASCIKCYACRSACPMCYCTKCAVECNQPQWISTVATGRGNLEWHIIRAMHLAGRCVNCGECVRACPMEIPLGLLTAELNRFAEENFNDIPGTKASAEYSLSHFKVDDKETFIR
jgi:ferredoxin